MDTRTLTAPARLPLDAPHGPADPPPPGHGGGGHGDHHHVDHDDHGPPPRPVGRMLHLLRPEAGDIGMVVLFSVGVGLLSLATPIAVQALVDNIQFGVMIQPLLFLVLAVLVCLGLAAMLTAAEAWLVEYLSQRLFVRVVADFARRLPLARVEAFDRRSGPELMNRFFDVLKVQKAVAVLLADAVNTAVALLVGLVVLALYHQYLLGFALVLLGLTAVLFLVAGWGGVRTGMHESHAKYDVAAWLEELARCPLAFKFGGGRYAVDRADALAAAWVHARNDHFGVWFRQFSFALLIYVAASTALLGLGGWLVIERQLTFGQLVASELIVGIVVAAYLKIGKYLDAWYDLCVGMEKLGMIADLPCERLGTDLPAHTDGPVAVAAHAAEYHAAGLPLLAPTTLTVRPGERVLLTGPSGSGKSVLLDLLAGLREPTGGAVTHDGVDLRDLRLEAARERVALVRSAEVIAGTIADNLRLGRPDATAAEMTAALAAAGLVDVVRRLPDGLNTELLSGGGPLTRGQADRLTLARALLRRPGLLILDGALDRFDPGDGPALLDALFAHDAPWTVVVVTSRPDVAARCTRTVAVGPRGPYPDAGRNGNGVH